MLKKAAEGHPVRVVNDQVLTPTFTGDLADSIVELIRTGAYGLYHVSAEGQCSWFEFARKIFELGDLAVDLKPVSSTEFASPVQRPSYSVLSKQKLASLGLGMPGWEQGLSRYLTARQARQPVASQ
jgi:dTDP-4-dehydrorhamnose reductase